MFHRKKKEIPLPQRRCRASIIHEALTLIAVANKAEQESLRSGDVETPMHGNCIELGWFSRLEQRSPSVSY
jgi:hypothetical protein